MSNKKRSLRRQVKVPLKYIDHVVGNLGQTRNEVIAEEDLVESRAQSGENKPIGENEKEMSGEVFKIPDLGTASNIVNNVDIIVDDIASIVDDSTHTGKCDNNEMHDNRRHDGPFRTLDVIDKNTQANTKNSYVSALNKDLKGLDNKLIQVPTVIRYGDEVVVFEEELVKEKRNDTMKFGYKPKVNKKRSDNVTIESNKDKASGDTRKLKAATNENSPNVEKVWNVRKENMQELRKSANKYAVPAEENEKVKYTDPCFDKRRIVGEFVNNKIRPTSVKIKDWTYDLIKYFKYQWEARERMERESSKEEDAYENADQATKSVVVDEVDGNY
ncbi:hypothetical protein Tco_0860227 [Tanacetum coccineum]|uniref:Transposase n=1 Tax=Tanacetum coccineum TaxID=301880 RepID=A0ABQ5BEA8_9ASTR